ncbi:hypothetical protein KRP22_006399 [Phytophthora ramorum]|uniref:Intraflagellar transport protein 74-like protein n=1 Tax=Phytophthora ramorum TaxID=164328 RepID=UPI0030B4D3B9|nr:Intraflagellar transport protein 74-like protein [Phytophthora ramorum]KAH7507368.1 Intraflagellar transport protein 74-like protein [Phytophthora ramorum]
MQLAELLRPFWSELLQNSVKNVKKFLSENRSKVDFNAARYTPCADGTGLHLCAQHGFIACARILLDVGVKIDLHNKVGSTALHVACKFNQEEMVAFLLDTGARMDIPDMRNNVAFDVAPYTLVDSCLLAPQREKLAAEEQEEARLLESHEAAVRHFEEVTLATAHASMLLIDWESRAWEGWQALQASNKLDREWSEQVQGARDVLDIRRAMYVEQQVLLQTEQDQIAQMWKNIFSDAQDRQQCAREELEQMLMLTEETEQHWLREQQELRDQCGLIEAAQEFPNDADVQLWVLSTMIAMIDEAEAGGVPVNPDQELVTTDINELLVRNEIASVIRDVLLRFPTVRELQFSAVQCFVRLVRHCINAPQLDCNLDSTGVSPQASSFLGALVKANVMELSRDALYRFGGDVELAHLVLELLYHLLRFRGEVGAHSLQFCQNRLSHQLPLHVLRLHEAVLPLQDDAESPQAHSIEVSPGAMLTARHHTSFLLFTLAKYNVRKSLDQGGALPLVRRLIFALTKSADTGVKELKASTLRFLLGSLALLHSPASTRQNSNKTSPRSNPPALWSCGDLSQLLEATRPWLAASPTSSDAWTRAHRSLAFWTIKLLRNLTQPVQDEVVPLRTWLRTRETFDLFAGIALTIREHQPQQGDDPAVQNVVIVWLEMVEDIWLCAYNSDGQLAATAAFILEFLLRQLELEAQIAGSREGGLASSNVAALLKLVALVLSNAKNMRYLVDREYKVDAATHTVLHKLLDRSPPQGSQRGGDEAILELLAHILRVYLRFFVFERDHVKSGVNLHERCRAIGICAALHAFGLPDSGSSKTSRCMPPTSNANQSNDKSAEVTANSKLKSKMQLARQWSRATGEQQPTHDPKRDTLAREKSRVASRSAARRWAVANSNTARSKHSTKNSTLCMSGRPGTSSGQRPGTGAGGGSNGAAPVGGLPSGRPGTGQSLNPITGARPGTGQRGMLLSASGGRPLTGRLGTGQQAPATPGQTAGFGVSLNTEVNVSDRPVTQQGMMGMRTGTGSAGPGRQVQDASFFKGKLHSKTAEIAAEVEKLQREIEQDAKDKAQCAQLERKYETMALEVRDLEGQLADYNLAMDKMRSATDPAEIRQVQEQLHQRNAKEAEDVDRVFLMNKEQEKSVRNMEDEMTEIHGKHQEKINQLAPQKLQRYKELLDEHHQTEVEIEARSQELELVMHAIHQKEAELSSDRYRDEYEALERQVRRLQKERDAAAEDAKTAQMDPNEARAVLLAKVKDDKSKMEALEGVLQSTTAEKQELTKALADLQSELDERASGSDPAHKYEALFAKDKEMTAFLEQFPAKREAETQDQRTSQGVIVQLLEHISAGMAKEDKLPGTNAANLEEMRRDLTFKERQLESSVTTKQRLTMELQKRQAELDKVNTLDAKIALELSSLLQKMDTMTADMGEFGKLDSLQEVHAQTKQHLLRLKKQYIGRRDAMRQQVTALSTQLENLVQESGSQETAKNLDALEQKLRHHEQNIFHLKEYIDSKSREVDYEHLKQDCFRNLQELNTLHVAQQQRQQQLNLGLAGGF